MARRRSRGKRRMGPSSPADAKRYVDEADDSDDDAVPIDHDSDDEEIDEDEAFGPEDEKKYGHYFQSKEKEEEDDEDDDGSDDDDDGDDDDDDEGDGGAYMLSLLDKIAPPSDGGGKDDSEDGGARVASSESEHAAPGGGGLTLEALARGSTDERGFAGVRADALAATRPAVPAPRAATATARAERDVRFAAARDDVSRWVDAVRTHRDAACLDLRPARAPAPTREALVDAFTAETELETRLSAALERATDAATDAVVAPDDDDDDLGRADLTVDQLKQRRGELSKMRALLFYEEQRRRHVNKIKSKKYRKIRRRKRERLAEAEAEARGGEDGDDDDDEAERLREKEDLDRARERMSLAHKNTSQWAKRQLRRGKALDKGTRQALSAQLRKGEDLKRKMMGDRDDNDDEEKDDATLLREAKALLSVGNEDQKEEETRKGLFGLSFMKKGIEAQRAKAMEEARQLLEELEADDDDDDDSHPEDEDKANNEQPSAPPPDGAELVRPGTLVASGFGETHGLRVDGCVDVGTGAETNKTATESGSEHDATLTLPPLDPDAVDDAKRTTDKTTTPRTTNEAALIEEAEKDRGDNPWLDRAAKKRRRKRVDNDHDATDGPNLVADQQDDDDEVAPAPPAVTEDDATKSKETKRPTSQLTQAELVKRAFAAPADAEDEFREEKERVMEREDPNRKKKKDADDDRKKGWGSWTGDGVKAALPPPPPPSSSRAKRRRRDGAAATHEAVLSPAVADEHRRRRGDDRLPHVIISEKRVKAAANALQIGAVPWPYSTREQYENSLKGAVGPEWNVDPAFREAVRPKVRVAAGRIVRPLSRRAKTASALPRRGPAKF